MKILIPKLINVLLWAVLIVLPTAISFYDIHHMFSPFKYPILVVLSSIILLLMIIARNIKWDLSSYFAVLWIFLVFYASYWAYDRELAFYGFNNGNGRYEGFFALLSYIVLWLAAKNYLIINDKSISVFFCGMIPFSVYALIQYYDCDPLVLHYGFKPLVFSTIGNPNFVGSLAVVLFVLSTILFVLKKKWIFFGFSLLFFSTLLICQTRSTWLSAIVILSLFFIFQVIIKKEIYKPLFLILGFSIVSFLLVKTKNDHLQYTSHSNNTTKNSTIISKTKSLKKEIKLDDEYGGSGRLKIWEITRKVVEENPMWGVGPENLRIALYIEQPELHAEYIRNTRTSIDKAHNEYLHMAVTCGLPALLAYLCILFLSFKSTFHSRFDSPFAMAFSLSVVAYLFQAFFNISVVAVAPVFWIFLGGLAGNRYYVD